MSGIERKSLWRPNSQLPWKAKKKGTDDYVWYEIVDNGGWEVCHFSPSSKGEEQEESFRQMAMLLCEVNGTNVIEIDDNEIEIEWRT